MPHRTAILLLAAALAPAADLTQFKPVLPVSFESNQGQLDLPATHLAPEQGWAFACSNVYGAQPAYYGPDSSLHISLLHPGGACDPELGPATGAVAHYYRGPDRAAWFESIPRHQSLTFRNVASGLDWRFQGDNHGTIQWQWDIAAGVDPSTFTLLLEHDSPYGFTKRGFISRSPAPVATQLGRTLPARWNYDSQTGIANLIVENRLVTAPLTITMTLNSNYDSGDFASFTPPAFRATRDSAGNWLSSFITSGLTALDRRTQGCYFGGTGTQPCPTTAAARFSPSGELLSLTYLLGSFLNNGRLAGADPDGNFYIAGETFSPDLPVTESAVQRTYSGPAQPGANRLWWGGDVFVAKLYGPTGGLISSTFIGASLNDRIYSIDVDISGRPTLLMFSATYSASFPLQPSTRVLRLNESFSAFDFDVLTGSASSIVAASDGTTWLLRPEATVDHLAPDGTPLETFVLPIPTGIRSFAVTSGPTFWFTGERFNGQTVESFVARHSDGNTELHLNWPLGVLLADKQENVHFFITYSNGSFPETLPPVTADALLPRPCAQPNYYARFSPDGGLSFATFLPAGELGSNWLDANSLPIFGGTILTAIDLAAPPTTPVTCSTPAVN